jgi:hypothetical protein
MIKETRHSQCLCSKHAYLDAIANADDDNYVHSTCYGMPESITRWYTRASARFLFLYTLAACVSQELGELRFGPR